VHGREQQPQQRDGDRDPAEQGTIGPAAEIEPATRRSAEPATASLQKIVEGGDRSPAATPWAFAPWPAIRLVA
jgi:hypothetical protein